MKTVRGAALSLTIYYTIISKNKNSQKIQKWFDRQKKHRPGG